MKKMNFILSISMLILMITAIGCKKDEKSSIGFSMKAVDSNAPAQTSQQSGQNPDDEGPVNDEHLALAWDVAWIYITQIQFSAELIQFASLEEIKGNPYVHYEWQGNQKVDLLAEPRIFAYLELPDGHYQNIELQLTSSRLSDAFEPNFYLAGRYGPLFGSTPIVVEITQKFSMQMKMEEGTVDAGSPTFFDGMIEMSLENAFSGISSQELDDAELIDGVILISATSNQDLYVKILANLQSQYIDERPSSLTWNFHVRP